MTRKEQPLDRKSQIEKASEEEGRVYSEGTIQAFKAGAEWADSTNPQILKLRLQLDIMNAALAGNLEIFDDLKQKLAIAVETLEKVAVNEFISYGSSFPSSYKTGVTDGHRLASKWAQEALQKIKKT